MTLAIFDLDNTLIAGDSDHAWGEYLVSKHLVDAEFYQQQNDRFFSDYLDGKLDIQAYLEFSLAPLTKHPKEQLHKWREDFLNTIITPIILAKGRSLIAEHREKGDTVMIITATNRFVTQPIADALGVEHLIAIEVEEEHGRYTGKPCGIPSYQEGKVKRLKAWLDSNQQDIDGAYFYSDSHNDLPLLELVDHPVAVDPDDTLARISRERGWPIISLRD